ncbi:phage major capsid protein [Leucobacter musarum]|uniref:phage major capsid protein n=1 Tax=Leucobacter musarum TaxID=1930747 RepID=UPI0006A7CB0A|nr:phage major capsid protein [Leucobacter musarum]
MATTTTSTTATAWSPDIVAFPATDAAPEALILQAATVAGSIEGDAPAVRVPFIDDAEASFTAEGAEISESDPELDEVVVHTGKITQLVKLSREQAEQVNTPDLISQSVTRAITRKANQAFLTQPAPTSPAVTPPAGILNHAEIPVMEPTAPITNLDLLVDLISVIEQNGGAASHIVLNPMSWARLRKLKTRTDSNESLLGAGASDAARQLLNLPVLIDRSMPHNQGLILDKNAIAAAVGEVKTALSEHVYFKSDSVAMRCTWRIGWNLVRPNRLGKFLLEPDTP